MKKLIQKSDEKLISLYLKTYNEDIFKILYDRYNLQLYKYLITISPKLRDEEVFDLVHDIFLKVFTKIDSIKDKKKFKSWLFTIARNILFESFRKQKFKTTSLDTAFLMNTIEDVNNFQENYLKDMEVYQIITEFSKTLNKDEQILFELRALQQLKIKDIMIQTNKKSYQIKYEFRKILKKLRKYVKKHKFYL